MRQLHLVGFTSDQDGMILAGRRGSKTGGYMVTMDEEFLELVDNARRMRAGLLHGVSAASDASRSRTESLLSPREMQTRLRGGRTVAQVATEAGVSIEWVERFAAPVLAEQAAAVERALSMTMRTQRRGHSDRPLGPSVLRNLADRGVRLAEDEFDELWTAFQLAENEWVVRFRHRARGREMDAEWVLDEGAGSLTPSNRQATELGFVDPGRHAPPVKGLAPIRVLRRAEAGPVPADAASPAAGESAVAPAKAPAAAKTRRAAKTPRTAKTAAAKKVAGPRARRPLKATRASSAGAAKRPIKAKKQAKKAAKASRPRGAAPAKTTTSAKAGRSAQAGRATKAAKAKKRPLKAVRGGANGKAHAGVRAVRAGGASRNGSASRRVASVSRAGGNGSRRSRA